jgi:divalent metal cation (Fe/Co/Zn/Cd) transporter
LPLPLVERSQIEIERKVRKQIESMKDVRACHEVHVRPIGKRLEISAHVMLDSSLGFDQVHKIVSDIDREVKKKVSRFARITIQTEPVGGSNHDMVSVVKNVAESVPGSRGVHDIHIQRIAGELCVDLHLEVSADMTVKEAHDVADQIEKKLKSESDISEVTIHIESASDLITRELKGDATRLRWYIADAVKRFPEIKTIHDVEIRKLEDKMHVVLSCHFDPDVTVKHAHDVTDKLEGMIKSAYPDVERIDIHEEPA